MAMLARVMLMAYRDSAFFPRASTTSPSIKRYTPYRVMPGLPDMQKISAEKATLGQKSAKPGPLGGKEIRRRDGAGEGNRTLVLSLGSSRSTIELRPRSLLKSNNTDLQRKPTCLFFLGAFVLPLNCTLNYARVYTLNYTRVVR